MKPLHLAAALLMVSVWGANFIVIRAGLNEVPPLTLTLLRFTLAAFPAVLLVPRPRVGWRALAAYGLFAFALQFVFLFGGMAIGMPTGLASLVIQIQAFFTIALAMFFTGERPRALQIAGSVAAGAGIVVIALDLPAGDTQVGLVLVLAAALSWAIGNLIVKRMRQPATPNGPLAIVIWSSAFACVPLAIAVLLVDGPATLAEITRSLSALQWLGIAFQAWPTTLLAFGLWAWLLRLYPATLIAPFTLLVPVVAMSGAAWLLDETISGWELAGAALVLAGLALNVFGFRR